VYFLFFTISCHIPVPTVYVSPFSRFLMFLASFQIIQCAFLIFPVFQCFLPYSRSYSVSVTFSTFFSFLAIIQVLQCVFLIFHVFHCFSPYSRSYTVFFSFCMFLVFLAIFTVLTCEFHIFLVFQFSCYIPGQTVFVSHFPRFSFFSPYSRTYSVHFSLS
jgi:hypothetical protein